MSIEADGKSYRVSDSGMSFVLDEDRERALSIGYLALVPKPIDVDVLFTLIHDLKAPA